MLLRPVKKFFAAPSLLSAKIASPAFTTWDKSGPGFNPNISISPDGLTATKISDDGNFDSFYTVGSFSGTKKYTEATFGPGGTSGTLVFGICNSNFAITSGAYGGSTQDTVGWIDDITVIICAGGFLGSSGSVSFALAGGDVIGLAVDDTSNRMLWYNVNHGDYLGDPTADPGTNTGGIDMTDHGGVNPSPYFWMATLFNIGDSVTLNPGAVGPSGFGSV